MKYLNGGATTKSSDSCRTLNLLVVNALGSFCLSQLDKNDEIRN